MKISKDTQPVIVKKDEKEPLFLVIKRFDRDKQEDHYRLVKGGVEEGETPEQAARRESAEEVGITTVLKTEFLASYDYTAGDIKHVVDAFLLITENSKDPLGTDSSNEGGFTIKEAMWCTKDDALSKLNFEIEKNMIEKASEKLLN